MHLILQFRRIKIVIRKRKKYLKLKEKEIYASESYVKGKKIFQKNAEIQKIVNNNAKQKELLQQHLDYEYKLKKIVEDIENYRKNIINEYKKLKELEENLSKKIVIDTNIGDVNDSQYKDSTISIKLNFKQIPLEKHIDYLNKRNAGNNSFEEHFNVDSNVVIQDIYDWEDKLSFNQGKSFNVFLEDIFSHHWKEISYDVFYNGDKFHQMSQGKKSFVILSLILEYSDEKIPVLIDQPEDNLDNRGIYNELTKYLINKKRERQIILVTHNPNVVVGADAENIIVANQHSNSTPNENKRKFDCREVKHL